LLEEDAELLDEPDVLEDDVLLEDVEPLVDGVPPEPPSPPPVPVEDTLLELAPLEPVPKAPPAPNGPRSLPCAHAPTSARPTLQLPRDDHMLRV
jgi:hypothetical protein